MPGKHPRSPSSAATASTWKKAAAWCRGVRPRLSRRVALAPASSKASKMSRPGVVLWVGRRARGEKLLSPPMLLLPPSCPRAAVKRGERPAAFTALGSAPASSRATTTPREPLDTATWRGVRPAVPPKEPLAEVESSVRARRREGFRAEASRVDTLAASPRAHAENRASGVTARGAGGGDGWDGVAERGETLRWTSWGEVPTPKVPERPREEEGGLIGGLLVVAAGGRGAAALRAEAGDTCLWGSL